MPKNDVESRGRFSLPKVDPTRVRYMVGDYGGRERVAADFAVHLELLDRWISGELMPPRYFLVALHWQGAAGYAQGFSETHYANHRNYRKLCEAQARIELLEGFLGDALGMLGCDGAHLTPPPALPFWAEM